MLVLVLVLVVGLSSSGREFGGCAWSDRRTDPAAALWQQQPQPDGKVERPVPVAADTRRRGTNDRPQSAAFIKQVKADARANLSSIAALRARRSRHVYALLPDLHDEIMQHHAEHAPR